jgi:hypothetical protein
MLAGKLWPNGEVWAGHLPRPSGMGLVNLRKNHNRPRGSHGITAHGRRVVRQGAHLLEELVGRPGLSFLTCTLPGKTLEECRAANLAWPEIMRRFLQELRRELLRRGAPGWFIGCTEIQPERYQSTGQPWPHLHIVFVGRTGKPWLISPSKATNLWGRVVNAVLGIPMDDLRWATTIKPLKGPKPVGKYLAKYMSKGSQDIAKVLDTDPDFPLPRAWHHCSHDLNELIRLGTATLTPNTAAWVIKLLQTEYPGSKLFAVIAPTPTENSPYDSPIGYVGQLDPPLANRVLTHNNQQKGRMNHDSV